MAQHDELIAILNEAVSLEYTASIQYNQHSMLVSGRDKLLFEDLFKDSAREALGHAKMWGDRIVYLGGVPKAEIGPIRQSTDITELLEIDLEIEQRAVAVYSRARAICKHEATGYMLENHILDEDKDVEELQKLLGRTQAGQAGATQRHAAGGGR
ncbi:MAG: ferritin-like domain-containing protein [Verrucomicrobiota bacterium]